MGRLLRVVPPRAQAGTASGASGATLAGFGFGGAGASSSIPWINLYVGVFVLITSSLWYLWKFTPRAPLQTSACPAMTSAKLSSLYRPTGELCFCECCAASALMLGLGAYIVLPTCLAAQGSSIGGGVGALGFHVAPPLCTTSSNDVPPLTIASFASLCLRLRAFLPAMDTTWSPGRTPNFSARVPPFTIDIHSGDAKSMPPCSLNPQGMATAAFLRLMVTGAP